MVWFCSVLQVIFFSLINVWISIIITSLLSESTKSKKAMSRRDDEASETVVADVP